MSGPAAGERPHDRRLLGLAIALGERHGGRTWPNPSVGAVLVDESGGQPRILAQGVTAPGGRPHAEPIAIASAGEAAHGATLYVSLEPCSHHGSTPPCAEAIVAAGIGRVVTALEDPDIRVAGRGHALLRSAGIDVVAGLLPKEARRVHLGHVTRVTEGRPAIGLKLARTGDGFAAAKPGQSRLMITGEGADARTHMMRAAADAVMVGIGTVLADDPRLDVRLPGLLGRQPIAIVLDSRLQLPAASRLARRARERPLLVLCRTDAAPERAAELSELGIDVLTVEAASDGRTGLSTAMATLATRGLTRILCEGGPALAGALAAADLVDELRVVTGLTSRVSPGGVMAIGPSLLARIGDTLRLVHSERAGDDLIEDFERASCSPAS